MNTTALKNIERVTREVSRAKAEYEAVSKKLVKQNKIEKALELTDVSKDLATLETMLNTISETFNPILRKLEIEVRRGRPRKVLEEELHEELIPTKKRGRGRPRKVRAEEVGDTSNVSRLAEIATLITDKDIDTKIENTTKQQNKIYSVPVKMTLLGNEYKLNKNWREVYINTLEQMIARKPKVVNSFATNKEMQGRTMTYFSFDESVPMISRYRLSNGMFVNLNLSSTAILTNCYKVLKECGYEEDVLKVEVENYTKKKRFNRKNLNL